MRIKALQHVFLLGLGVMFFSCAQNEGDIYVSPEGNDSNNGTIDKPLATISAARDKLRKLKKEGEWPNNAVHIYLKEGIYELDETLVFNELDSGTINSPLIISSYNNEKVSISGGRVISSEDFSPVDDQKILQRIISDDARKKILQADLKSLGISDYGAFKQHGFSVAILPAPMELFVDGKPEILARWPNQGTVYIPEVLDEGSLPIEEDFSYRGGTFMYDDERHELWKEPENVWLWGYFKAGYADDNIGIESIDTVENTIKLKNPHIFGITKTNREHEWTGRNTGYYAYNILEEIDMPGEYYIDHETGVLYYYPAKNFDDAKIVVSLLEEPLLALEGVSNIIFEGVTIEYGKGMGVYIERGRNNKFRGCTVRNFGTLAFMFGKGITGADYPIHEFTGSLKSRAIGNLKAHHYQNTQFYNFPGKNHGIIGCDIYYTGTGGLVLSGGNRTTLERGNNYIENSNIHTFNRHNKTYAAGITLYGVGNSIKHCYIHDAPHQGIALFGNEHLIEYNKFEELVKNVHDNGAIYMGRNPSERGNVIQYNYFANLGKEGYKNCALHMDDGSSDFVVKGNIFYKSAKMDFGAIVMNGGSDNLIINNIILEGTNGIWLEDPIIAGTPFYLEAAGLARGGIYWQRMRDDLDITSEAWKEKYPEFAKLFDQETPFLNNNRVKNNVFYKTNYMISKHGFDSTRFEVWEDNWITDQDPGFVDLENQNFNLKKDAIVYDKIPGFETIPFDKIGMQEGNYRDMLKK